MKLSGKDSRPPLRGPGARWLVVFGLVLLAGVAAACGSGPSPSASRATAKSLNLVASDLPKTWKQTPKPATPNVVRDALDHCLLQAGSPAPTASESSDTFVDPASGQTVSSQVQAYSSTAQSTSAAKKAGSKAVSQCLQSQVSAALSKTLASGETLKHVSARANSVPGLASGEFSQRVEALTTFSTGTGTAGSTTFTDVIGFASGSELVEAQFESTGSLPTAAVERQVMSALKQRAAGQG